MRINDIIPDELEKKIRRTAERDHRLIDHLRYELEEGYSARSPQDKDWEEETAAYNGVPKNPIRNIPFENAPNIVVTLGAIACDALYAQATDLIWTATPPITCRPVTTGDKMIAQARVDSAKSLQSWTNWGSNKEWGGRDAWDDSALDDIQLGTGVFYIPWIQSVKKTDIWRVTDVGPRIIAVPIEDFLVPGGYVRDLQSVPWVAMRTWLTEAELKVRAKKYRWDIDGVKPVGTPGWTRSKRERLGRTRSRTRVTGALCELHDIYVRFDYDGDGLEEDLLVIFDRHAGKIVWLSYNPYDKRPFEWMRYQKRAHLGYGMGVMRMILPYQDECTEQHNDRLANQKLANTTIFRTRAGMVPGGSLLVFHGKVIEGEKDDIEAITLGQVNAAAFQSEQITISLAERRVGSGEIASPRPSQLLGGRTPGITALSVLQQANRRFTPAFDAMRFALAGAHMQCVYRYRERLLAGDRAAAQNILRVMGAEEGKRIIRLLMSDHFEDGVDIEMTATSVSVNREADRQNMLALIGIMGNYYEKVMQLVQIASTPGVMPQIVETAQKIAKAVGELIDRTLRTFDQMRDPQSFIVEIESTLDSLPVDQSGLSGLMQMLSGGGQGQPTSGAPAALPMTVG